MSQESLYTKSIHTCTSHRLVFVSLSRTLNHFSLWYLYIMYSSSLILHFHKVGGRVKCMKNQQNTSWLTVPSLSQAPKTLDPTFPIMQLSSVSSLGLPCLANAHILQTPRPQFVTQAVFCYKFTLSKPSRPWPCSDLALTCVLGDPIWRRSGPHMATFFSQCARVCVLGHTEAPPTELTSLF